MKTKEIKFRPRTEVHDLTYKSRHAKEFLEKGHRVKLTVMFQGREMAHPEYGEKILQEALGMIGSYTLVTPVKMDGRNMFMLIGPGK